jgi:PilZ domain
MGPLTEQRRHFRKRVFKTAQIVVTESAPILECRARDLSDYGARLCLSATYGLPQQFDVIIDGARRSVRSVWRTCTEMGVMFAEASQEPADFLERERDVASLIELLKMADEKWPGPGNNEISETEMLSRDQTLLEMWPEACRRVGFPEREFPVDVIKRWQKKMGWPN